MRARLRVFTATLLLLAGSGCAARRAPAPQPELAGELEALLTGLHDRGLFDGAVVVGRGREILWEGGYGYANLDRKVRFTPDTPADGGSLAKTLTAALVLMLAGEGRLELDAPAQRLLPELPYPELTLRQLLSHSAGLPDYDFFDAFLPAGTVRTTETLLAVLQAERPPLAFAPGSAFEYNSLGFDLAALAAGRAAGTSYAELVAARFFAPLGMTSAFLRPGRFSEFPQPRTVGYRRVGGVLERHEVFDFEAFHGGSNVYLSARDLHRWNASFLARPLLAPAPLAAALAPARIGGAPSGLTLGSWYRTADDGAFWYSGHLQGFHDEAFRDLRAGWSIVYVSNNTLDPWLQKGLVRGIRALLGGAGDAAVEPPQVDELRPEERGLLAGRWLLADGETLAIEGDAARLRLLAAGVAYRLVPIGHGAFYVPGTDLMIGYRRAAGGSRERLCAASNVDERWGERAPAER